MGTSLKTGFAQIFSCCPKNLSCPKFGGAAAPLAPPARTPMISARFLRHRDRETVLRVGFDLKDTEYMILQDVPQKIIERRRKQMPKLKDAKTGGGGQKVSFGKSEPDRLHIDDKFISA